MKLANLSKILKCAANDDAITMKSEDNGDAITFIFESPSEQHRVFLCFSHVLPFVPHPARHPPLAACVQTRSACPSSTSS